jgi:hypothetical protein
MTIFLILAPFGAFALLMLVTAAQVALFASAAICLAVIGIDVARGARSRCSAQAASSCSPASVPGSR